MLAAGDAKPDWRIMCDVATHMGFAGFYYQSSAGIFAEHAKLTQVLNSGNRALDLGAIAAWIMLICSRSNGDEHVLLPVAHSRRRI